MTMVARATMAEIDTVRMSIDEAVELFRESVIPALHEQPGYCGVYVLLSPEGQVLALTFWERSSSDRERSLRVATVAAERWAKAKAGVSSKARRAVGHTGSSLRKSRASSARRRT